MLKPDYISKELNRFAKNVITKARSNLTRQDKNVSKELYDSFDYEVKVMPNSISLRFISEAYAEYGIFQDKGVKGADPSLVKNGVQKAPLGKFTFKNKMPPLKPILDWVKFRKIRLRDEKGKFKKGSYKSVAHIIQKRIYAQGIKPSLFFTKPYLKAFNNLPEDLVKAYGLDVTTFIKNINNE